MGPGFQGASQELVVCGILGNPVGFVTIGRDDEGLFPYEIEQMLFFAGNQEEFFLDGGFAKGVFDFGQDLSRDNQLKGAGDPELLQLAGAALGGKETADKQVGIDNRSNASFFLLQALSPLRSHQLSAGCLLPSSPWCVRAILKASSSCGLPTVHPVEALRLVELLS